MKCWVAPAEARIQHFVIPFIRLPPRHPVVEGNIRMSSSSSPSDSPADNLTILFHKIEAGDEEAAHQILPLAYGELRKLAAAKMAHERPGQGC